MASLTTRQRDIIRILLKQPEPVGAGEIAERIHLSTRQITYNLKGVTCWLKEHGITLQTTQGVGMSLECTDSERSHLLNELENITQLQLILTPEERQQLLYFTLLFETSPVIVNHLAHLAKVSQTTILKDLNVIQSWLASYDLVLQKRQNYGMWIEGPEQIRQQALAHFLWEGMGDGKQVFQLSFHNGLEFALADDAGFLPLVKKSNDVLAGIDFKKVFNRVVLVENMLGGKFTDKAVLVLALVLTILYVRHLQGQPMQIEPDVISKLQESPVWNAAKRLLYFLDDTGNNGWSTHEVAYVIMYILSAPRHENWPNELDYSCLTDTFILHLLEEISILYDVTDLRKDPALYGSLVNHLTPVCNQHLYNLWFPQTQSGLPHDDKFLREHVMAGRIATLVHEEIAVSLSKTEQTIIASLLRAAYIRLQTYDFRQVLVVCPSGMATAQLMIARLKTRFPHLGTLTVTSYRELDLAKIEASDLVITLLPLPDNLMTDTPVILVSPQLLPEDINAITTFLS